MTCRYSVDGTLVVCGGHTRRGHFFTKDFKSVFHHSNLWYDPDLILRRKRGESKTRFVARATKQLGFRPLTQRGWWRVIAVPQLREVAP